MVSYGKHINFFIPIAGCQRLAKDHIIPILPIPIYKVKSLFNRLKTFLNVKIQYQN